MMNVSANLVNMHQISSKLSETGNADSKSNQNKFLSFFREKFLDHKSYVLKTQDANAIFMYKAVFF